MTASGEQHILALDAGTTSSRAIVFDGCGTPQGTHKVEFRQHYPQPGWVEHDPEDIWTSQVTAARMVLGSDGATSGAIAAIGLTNQRETTLVWERDTGRPVYPAIVWQDRRTAAMCDALRHDGWEATIREKTGLTLDAYFSATKLQWILHHVDGATARARRGELLFGTVDTFLLWRLTGEALHATDMSNASRTMLFNIHTLRWDDDLLRELDIPPAMLPEVRSSSGNFGVTVPDILGVSLPIRGVAGDQQAATFGQGCFEPGTVKNTYGTGNFMVMNTGTQPHRSTHGLLTTVAWQINGRVTYALEGSVFVTGAAVQWLRDELNIVDHAEETAALAASVPDTGGVYVVPAFAGLGAPHWDQYARGTIVGLTRGTGRAHIVRATLESVAYQSRDLLEAMRRDCGLEIPAIRVDGGMVVNDFLMQFQADVAGIRLERPAVAETTALGAAYLAGLATDIWDDVDQLRRNPVVDRVFEPAMSTAERDRLYRGWQRAVDRSRNWATEAEAGPG